MLALRIGLQNALFEEFEARLESQIEGAIAAGTHAVGVETLIAESFEIIERRTVYTHAATGAETRRYRFRRRDPTPPLGLAKAHRTAPPHPGEMVVNPVPTPPTRPTPPPP